MGTGTLGILFSYTTGYSVALYNFLGDFQIVYKVLGGGEADQFIIM